MPVIVNDLAASTHPVTIETSLSASGELVLTANGVPLPDGETLRIRHRTPTSADPADVPVTLVAPGPHARVVAQHVLDSGQTVAWASEGADRCRHAWKETAHEYAVVVTVQPSANEPPKKRTVYLKVELDHDLPDP